MIIISNMVMSDCESLISTQKLIQKSIYPVSFLIENPSASYCHTVNFLWLGFLRLLVHMCPRTASLCLHYMPCHSVFYTTMATLNSIAIDYFISPCLSNSSAQVRGFTVLGQVSASTTREGERSRAGASGIDKERKVWWDMLRGNSKSQLEPFSVYSVLSDTFESLHHFQTIHIYTLT